MRHALVVRFFLPCIALTACSFLSNTASGTDSTLDLSPRIKLRDVADVTVELQVGGELRVRDQQKPQAQPQKLPMSVAAQLQYEERRLPAAGRPAPTGSDAGNRLALAARYYQQAEAVLKIDKGGTTRSLPDDRRLIIVAGRPEPGTRLTFHAPGGPLERDQLDLINVVGNSLAVDLLLPSQPIDQADTWKTSADTMGVLLGLDSVAVCEVESVVEKSTAEFIQVRFAGNVHGTVDGAATELDLRGVYLFDRQQHRITHMNLAVKEKRSIGAVTPGLDVVAKLELRIKPLPATERLGDEVIASLDLTSESLTDHLQFRDASLGFCVVHDRQWFVTSEQRDAVTLRRIQDGDLVAHCTIRQLPPKSAGRQVSLQQFQKDIRFALREGFREFVRAGEWTNQNGHACLSAQARGTVEELPVEWHYYLVSQETGHRVSIAVTVQEQSAHLLADNDRQLVDKLSLFVPEKPAEAPAHNKPQEVASTRSAAEPISDVTAVPERSSHNGMARRRSNRPSSSRGRR